MSEYKEGDWVVVTDNQYGHGFDIGDYVILGKNLKTFSGTPYWDAYKGEQDWAITESEFRSTGIGKEKPSPDATKGASDGGPTSYYDMPFSDWTTVNDQMEYLAKNKWGSYGIHLKDIFKGLCRWGDKKGTSVEYDTYKIIYYGVRVLSMLKGKAGVQEYLQKLMDDPQFKDKK